MRRRLFFLPACVAALAGAACGKSDESTTSPTTPSMPLPPFMGAVSGDYDLVVTPATACSLAAGPYTVLVRAQQINGPMRNEVRATLPPNSASLVLEMLFVAPGVLRGSISSQIPIAVGNGLTLFLRNVGTGSLSAGTGGRGEVRDGTMTGDVEVGRAGADPVTCTSTAHRWSLRAR